MKNYRDQMYDRIDDNMAPYTVVEFQISKWIQKQK